MKKYILRSCLAAFGLLTSSMPLLAMDCYDYLDCCDCINCCKRSDLSLSIRTAYFRPQSKKIQRIYASGWVEYQIELAKRYRKNWQVWAGISRSSKKGHSLGLHQDTKMRLLPLSVGVKYLIPLNEDVNFYLGAGLCYTLLKIRDHSRFVHEHISKQAFGGVAQVGFYYNFNECLFLNIFTDFYYQKFRFFNPHHHNSYSSGSDFVVRHDLNMSGFKVGVGLGLYF